MIRTYDKTRNGFQNGKWKEFNKHAILISEGVYINNQKHGIWREYYDDTGSKMIEENYKNGSQHGRFASYHPNGQLMSEGYYQNGLREGYFKVYDEEGKNIKSLLFINDNQIEDDESTGKSIKGKRH
jgi:antitoxin component YwqK of YwqJK toxin-antitoxin module